MKFEQQYVPKEVKLILYSIQGLDSERHSCPLPLRSSKPSMVTHTCKLCSGGEELQVRSQTRLHSKTLSQTYKIDKLINKKEIKFVSLPFHRCTKCLGCATAGIRKRKRQSLPSQNHCPVQYSPVKPTRPDQLYPLPILIYQDNDPRKMGLGTPT